jgi:ABC-type multidrug transport system fused ATPase/permease subunit
LGSAKDKKPHLDSGTVTSVLKRVIAENGRDHIKGYAFAIFCLVVVAATTAFTAWIMEAVVNEAFANQRADIVWLICGAIFVAFVLRGLATYGQSVTLSKIGNNIVARYQRRLYSHLMGLSVGFFSEARSAHLAAQISQNVNGVRDVLNLTVTSTARDLLTLIALIGVMVSKDPILSLIVFVVAPPLILALRYVSRRLRSATRESVELNSHVLGAMQETIQGISIVKAFTMEKELGDKVEKLISQAENRANRIARLTERTAPLTETFAGFAISSVLAYAAFRSIYDGVPPGAFFAFVTALLMAYDPARRLAKLQVHLERAVVNARMIYALLDLQPQQREKPGAKDLKVTEARIEFRGVSFAYASGDPVLRGVDLVADGGKTTALVGPSGAGKSTIINLIPRFYDPSEGCILIDGQDIAKVTKMSLRRHIAYRVAAAVSVRGHDRRQHPLRPPRGCDRCGSRGGRQARLRTRLHPRPAASATTRRRGERGDACREVSASACRSLAPWFATRRSCCSTRRRRRSTTSRKQRVQKALETVDRAAAP